MEERNFQTSLRTDTGRILPETRRPSPLRWLRNLLLILLIPAGILCYFYIETTAPPAFTPDTFVLVPDGASLGEIAKLLEKDGVIRSSLLFNITVAHLGKEKSVVSGMYLFKTPIDLFAVALRMASGDHGIETRKITLPEGFTVSHMSETFSRELPNFAADEFITTAHTKEGYLFPDTYFFFLTATSGPVFATLSDNFSKKTAALAIMAAMLHKNWSDTIIMASILEGEAATPLDRRIVSQILWKRIAIGMRLGVDAPFMYTLGKGSLELTQSDLTSDSPYNTYKNAGLPPTPIGNPGLDAIDAALHPATTTYLYYLSDRKGVMHYTKTFEEHKLNKTKFLY